MLKVGLRDSFSEGEKFNDSQLLTFLLKVLFNRSITSYPPHLCYFNNKSSSRRYQERVLWVSSQKDVTGKGEGSKFYGYLPLPLFLYQEIASDCVYNIDLDTCLLRQVTWSLNFLLPMEGVGKSSMK